MRINKIDVKVPVQNAGRLTHLYQSTGPKPAIRLGKRGLTSSIFVGRWGRWTVDGARWTVDGSVRKKHAAHSSNGPPFALPASEAAGPAGVHRVPSSIIRKKNIMIQSHTPVALITGASQGLGLSIAEALIQSGWTLIINARRAGPLLQVQRQLAAHGKVIAVSGDVRDEVHLLQFPELLEREALQLDLVINNASTLGASPQPALLDYPMEVVHQIYHTNVLAPLSLLQKVRPYLREEAMIINISSDAAVEAYEGWGGYGASKAALDHWTAILAKEQPDWHVYAFDPGDMRTRMHQEAFPGEDISDRPLPETKAVPALLRLIGERPDSGRYAVGEWPPATDDSLSAIASMTLLK